MHRLIQIATIALVALFGASAITADFTVDWATVDGGGGDSSGGGFVLAGTIGQPDVGTMSGGGYTLTGGYWAGVTAAPAPPCPADLTGDGVVNGADIALVLGSWGPCVGCPADLTGDGVVNGADISTVLGAWGPCPE
ncbi:MAG: hypothetical protein KF724_11505 [Phycisphaeraceae bacterium]|nr:hypothetical protein [Phycisphaeraceae bacterium]